MAASCGDELAEDWWETKGSGRESRTSRKRSKDSASTCPFGTEAGDSPVPKKKRKKRSVKSAVEGDEVRIAARSSGGARDSKPVVCAGKG